MTTNLGSADGVRIEAEEDGFMLYLDTDEGAFRVNVQAVAEALVTATQPIRQWMYEGRVAAFQHSGKVPDFDNDGYEPNDPKRIGAWGELL